MSSTTLRPEARSVPWSQLDVAQRGALERMVALLDAALNDLSAQKGRREPELGLVLDSDRASRNVFLSGERGTGKTTVLLSLREACYWARIDRAAPAGYLKADDTEVEKTLGDLWTKTLGFADRLVWLEPIDMEPLPSSTNLLAAILARVDKAVKPDEPHSRSGSREAGARRAAHGLLDPSPDYHQALMDLQELMTSVALAWDGNITQRAGSVDPDTYAVEVMRAEKARLSLNQKMNDVLDQLARKVFDRGATRDPLFVLPVDDFDLNPPRSLDLLRLLRATSVPRLFNIILGDVRVAEVVFNLNLSRSFIEVAGDPRSSEFVAVQPDAVQKVATELAANAVRKLIPPAQSIHLRSMSTAEALYYRPIASAAGEKRLYQILEQCPLVITPPGAIAPITGPPENLYTFLLRKPAVRPDATPVSPAAQPADATTSTTAAAGAITPPSPAERDRKAIETDVLHSPYSAKTFLNMTPRRAADMWQSLREALARPSSGDALGSGESVLNQFLEVLVESCRKGIAEDVVLSYAERQILWRAFERGAGDEWELDTFAYEEEPKVGAGISLLLPEKEIRSPPRRGRAATGGKPQPPADSDDPSSIPPAPPPGVRKAGQARQIVRASRGKGWRLWARGGRGDDPDPSRRRATAPPMEDVTASLVMLIQDILVLGQEGRWLGRQLMPNLPVLKQWAVTEWRVDYWLKTTVTWPTPTWATFWEYDRFLGRWNYSIDSLNSATSMEPRTKLMFLAYAWIDAATAVLAWEEFQALPNPHASDWPALARRVAALLDREGGDELADDRVRYWVLDVAYMLLPEVTGIGDAVISHFTAIRKLRDFWSDQVEEMRSYRLRVLRGRFAGAGMLNLANDLGGRTPQGLPDRLNVQLVTSYHEDRSVSFIDAELAPPSSRSSGDGGNEGGVNPAGA